MTKRYYVLAAFSALALALSNPAFARDHNDDHDGHHHGHHHKHHYKDRVVYRSYTVIRPQIVRQRVVTTYTRPGTTIISTTTPFASGGDEWLNYRISTREATVLQSYYQPYWTTRTVTTTTLPPGLYRHKHLPYGWQQKLHRGYRMDSVMYEYAQPVPVQVIQQLPPQPQGTVLMEIDGKIVRLAQATQTIVDILEL